MASKNQFNCEECGVTVRVKVVSDDGLEIRFCPCCGADLDLSEDIADMWTHEGANADD